MEKIRKIFTEKVCSKILKEKADLDIKFKNNVIYDWIYDGQLSLKSCNSHLTKLLRKVKLFEIENDNLD